MPKNLYSQKYTTVKLNAVPDKAESTSEQRCHPIQNIVPTFHYIGNEVHEFKKNIKSIFVRDIR